MNPHPPPAGPHVNPQHPSLTRLNSRQVNWASIPGRSRLGLNSRQVQTGPQFQAVLGSHAVLRPATWVHMPSSCARHLGSHALLRPATWVHMPSSPRHLGSHRSCAPPPGFTCPPRPATWRSHALLPSSAPPPGVHMPSCAPPPGVHMPSSAPPPGVHMPSCPPPPRHLGFTCPPAPRHLGFTCPPAPRLLHAPPAPHASTPRNLSRSLSAQTQIP